MHFTKKEIKGIKTEFINFFPKKDYCLLGLQGSRGFGLNKDENSDYDYRGIYVEDNKALLSLNKPYERADAKSEELNIEIVAYEVEKFIRLALKANPSILEILFLKDYNIKNNVGDMLIENRDIFLGEKIIRPAFAGYALSQMNYLHRNHKFPTKGARTEEKNQKHIRHCFRLFDNGRELLETGKITLPLDDPHKYFLLDKLNEDELWKLFQEKDEEFRKVKSVLPSLPNEDMADLILLKIRGFYR
jgi:predicted nucleotidyltransferase